MSLQRTNCSKSLTSSCTATCSANFTSKLSLVASFSANFIANKSANFLPLLLSLHLLFLFIVNIEQSDALSVEIVHHELLVDGLPFFVKGVGYSPVPGGESVDNPPYGDYFLLDHAYLWQRDFASIKAMGANTIRIYGWNNTKDHSAFLDAVYEAGLKIIPTYYLGIADQNPINTPTQRQHIIDQFVEQVRHYADHPAILMWIFGNELNGYWNGFLKTFNEQLNCNWNTSCTRNQDRSSPCFTAALCMWKPLLEWIDEASQQAKAVALRPVISGFADVDFTVGEDPQLDKLALLQSSFPSMDVIAVQVYRGKDFGSLFDMFEKEFPNKLLLISEYGTDNFNDPCGWPENIADQPCSNKVTDPRGGVRAIKSNTTGNYTFIGCSDPTLPCVLSGEEMKVRYDVRMSSELLQHAFNAEQHGVVLGGILMEWHDENWKNHASQDHCDKPCSMNDFDSCRASHDYLPYQAAGCSWKAHITCWNYDSNVPDICGYFLGAAPDRYVNEAYFGINELISCNLFDSYQQHHLHFIQPRNIWFAMRDIWKGNTSYDPLAFASCQSVFPCYDCIRSNSIHDVYRGLCRDKCSVIANIRYDKAAPTYDFPNTINQATPTLPALLDTTGSYLPPPPSTDLNPITLSSSVQSSAPSQSTAVSNANFPQPNVGTPIQPSSPNQAHTHNNQYTPLTFILFSLAIVLYTSFH